MTDKTVKTQNKNKKYQKQIPSANILDSNEEFKAKTTKRMLIGRFSNSTVKSIKTLTYKQEQAKNK